MTDQPHQAILQAIAEKINDKRNRPPKGFEQTEFKAHYFDAGVFLDEAGLMVTGALAGTPLRFTQECFLWLAISEDKLHVQLNAVQIDEQNSWVIDDRVSQSDHMDVVLLEQTIERFCEFYSEFLGRDCDDGDNQSKGLASVNANYLSAVYLAILNERFVQRSFLLSDPNCLDHLHAHLVKLGMNYLPKI